MWGPTVASILASLSGCKYFAKLDLRNGYWQFPVEEKSRQLLAFMLWGKMWQYRVVPMGYMGSSFYTQRTMCGLFVDRFARGVLIYLDDVIIYAETFEEFLELLEYALEVMLKANLSCKRSKCFFGVKEIMILGHVVSSEGVWMHQGRIDAVLEVPFPRNAKELRRFLGMTNYMRSFVPEYSMLAKPLTSEVNNPVGEWPQEAMREAFKVLKRAVASQMALMHLDYSVHPISQKERRVNLIIYLNKEWKEEYNGDIQLWNSEFTHSVQKIYPVFNTAVLFNTSDDSWHGLPTPIKCPPNTGRK
jgi:hypothetical protein